MTKMLAGICLLVACGGDGDANPEGDAGTADAAASAATYQAFALATALDRIAIVKTDPDSNLCGLLRLASPANGSPFDVVTPNNWAIDLAGASEENCDGGGSPTADEQAMSGSGEVTFTVPAGMIFPTTVTVDATIVFDTASAPPWLPMSIEFVATDIPIE